MIYKWELRSSISSHKHVILKGQVEADNQEGVMEILSKEKDIHPHTGEILEIFSPEVLEKGNGNELLLT